MATFWDFDPDRADTPGRTGRPRNSAFCKLIRPAPVLPSVSKSAIPASDATIGLRYSQASPV